MANELRNAISKAFSSSLAIESIVKEIDEFESGCPEIEQGGVHILTLNPGELIIKVSPYDRQLPAKFFRVKITETKQR